MPLSEEELRLLEQMERALVQDDPKLASTLRGTARRRHARRRAIYAAVGLLVGIGILMAGAILEITLLGIVGFLVMLACASIALASWRAQSQGSEHAHHAAFDLGGSLRERFEGRFRRRKDDSGS